ncbi:MAG: thioredoxin family protein, partial [Planctomycetota bacterium]|nr:thioredoxin family protein [Planctomycetota bacterium]
DLTNDGAAMVARIRTLWTTEGKIIEFMNIKLDLPYTVDGKDKTAPYTCVFFFALDKGKKTPEWLAVERDGWREGTATIAGTSYVLAVVDDDSDGQFSTGDSWVMRPLATDPNELLSRDATRSMLFPSWSTDQKWTVDVKSVATDGTMATLRVKPAKEDERAYFTRVARQQQTPEEKALKLDPLRPKADGNDKVDWIRNKDFAYALEIAKNPRVRKNILLAFESKRCPHCRNMAKYTFRDREVVNLSKKFVCSTITFKAGGADVTKFSVKGTPTYVLVGMNGAVKAQSAGFKRPAEFAAWLKAALR